MNRGIVRIPRKLLETLLRGDLHGLASNGPEDLRVIRTMPKDPRYADAEYVELLCESGEFCETYSCCPISVHDIRLTKTCGYQLTSDGQRHPLGTFDDPRGKRKG